MKITIETTETGWTVKMGDRNADRLTWDEMFGLVAALTMPLNRSCAHWMRTKEQHEADDKRFIDSIVK